MIPNHSLPELDYSVDFTVHSKLLTLQWRPSGAVCQDNRDFNDKKKKKSKSQAARDAEELQSRRKMAGAHELSSSIKKICQVMLCYGNKREGAWHCSDLLWAFVKSAYKIVAENCIQGIIKMQGGNIRWKKRTVNINESVREINPDR